MSETSIPSSLSPSEMHIYQYLLKNYSLVKHMTIRELSAASYSSTSSIMRLVRKFGYPGYAEFQSSLQKAMTCNQVFFQDEREFSLNTFFNITCKDEKYLHSLKRAASVISACSEILFTGDAYGRCACESGMRLFEYYGKKTGLLEHPVTERKNNVCVIAVMGSCEETEAEEFASSLPIGYIPVILIYCGGFRPSVPCDEISCVYSADPSPKALSVIPAVHTLELLQKEVMTLC